MKYSRNKPKVQSKQNRSRRNFSINDDIHVLQTESAKDVLKFSINPTNPVNRKIAKSSTVLFDSMVDEEDDDIEEDSQKEEGLLTKSKIMGALGGQV